MANPRILIITNYGHGGVESMLKLFLKYINLKKSDISLACYAPYSIYPELSVTLINVLKKKPKFKIDRHLGYKRYLIGTFLPEFEFNHHNNAIWKKIINEHDKFYNISGTIITSYSLYKNKKFFFNWVASPVHGDRYIRISKLNIFRRIFDKVFIEKRIMSIEKEIVNYKKQKLYALSQYTKKQLEMQLYSKNSIKILRYGINNKIFFSNRNFNTKKINIGFIGRFDDPRKNIKFLINIFNDLKDKLKLEVELFLIGSIEKHLKGKYINNHEFISDPKRLNLFYNKIDFFIVSSYQEGLCISALEAMSCGCIVLSTKCHGTEEYLSDSRAGYYLENNVEIFTKKIKDLSNNTTKKKMISNNAVNRINKKYSEESFKTKLENIYF